MGKVKVVVEGVGERLGDGERDLEMFRTLSCAERWPLVDVELKVALVTARSGRAAARASERVDGVVEASGEDAGGASSGVDAVGFVHGFHMYDMGSERHRQHEYGD